MQLLLLLLPLLLLLLIRTPTSPPPTPLPPPHYLLLLTTSSSSSAYLRYPLVYFNATSNSSAERLAKHLAEQKELALTHLQLQVLGHYKTALTPDASGQLHLPPAGRLVRR